MFRIAFQMSSSDSKVMSLFSTGFDHIVWDIQVILRLGMWLIFKIQ